MVTILISGSGTGVGKTQVTAALAGLAHRRGHSVQIVKPVQTGVARGEPTDAEIAAKLAHLPSNMAHTLRRFRAALAPLAAAKQAGAQLELKRVAQEILALPQVDFRFVEGAGGIAVPLGPRGWDWADFVPAIDADAVMLVIPDELGAINQARLAYAFARHKCPKKLPIGVILNAISAPPIAVARSTRAALIDCQVPLWGELSPQSVKLKLHDSPLVRWLNA